MCLSSLDKFLNRGAEGLFFREHILRELLFSISDANQRNSESLLGRHAVN